MSGRRLGSLLCLQLFACTEIEEPTEHVELVVSSDRDSGSTVSWTREIPAVLSGCEDVAGQTAIELIPTGPSFDDPAFLQRVEVALFEHGPHRPIAARRVTTSLGDERVPLYAVAMAGTGTPRIIHCFVPDEPTLRYELLHCTHGDNPSGVDEDVRSGVSSWPYYVGLLDGAVRIFEDVDALAACLPPETSWPAPKPSLQLGIRFVEQIMTGPDSNKLVLVEMFDDFELRRTEVYSWCTGTRCGCIHGS